MAGHCDWQMKIIWVMSHIWKQELPKLKELLLYWPDYIHMTLEVQSYYSQAKTCPSVVKGILAADNLRPYKGEDSEVPKWLILREVCGWQQHIFLLF